MNFQHVWNSRVADLEETKIEPFGRTTAKIWQTIVCECVCVCVHTEREREYTHHTHIETHRHRQAHTEHLRRYYRQHLAMPRRLTLLSKEMKGLHRYKNNQAICIFPPCDMRQHIWRTRAIVFVLWST
jgi:hypothetical protein